MPRHSLTGSLLRPLQAEIKVPIGPVISSGAQGSSLAGLPVVGKIQVLAMLGLGSCFPIDCQQESLLTS